MEFFGSFKKGYEPNRGTTIDIPAGKYSNGTFFKLKSDGATPPKFAPAVITIASDIDSETLGILMIAPEGVKYVAGDRADLTTGNIRIDIEAYEKTRLQEIEEKGSSTMADFSALLIPPLRHHSITGKGCMIQLEQVSS
jgi:hypothetical protein